MGSPWPAPSADDEIVGRGPNYALRRAVVVLAVVGLIGAGIAWWVSRGGEDDDGVTAGGSPWNTLVLQDERTGKLTLRDADGETIDTYPSNLRGLLDVGLPDRLVVGVAGEPSTDGLGVIDLDNGDITRLEVETDTVVRLDDSPYLLVSGGSGDPLALVDVAAGEVVDLLAFADNDDPTVKPALVRIDPAHAHVAYTELGELETVVVDIDDRSSVSLAGTLADMSSDAVLTLTNRGATSLADLYGLDGERLGTVETDAAFGGLVLDDHSALVVTRGGALVHVDFDDESVDELGSIADHLVGGTSDAGDSATTDTGGTEPTSDADETDLVRGVVPIADRTRLVVLSRHGMVIIDAEGNVIANDRVTGPGVARSTSSDRCVLIGGSATEQTLWEATEGTRIETFDPGFLTGRSADGCTVSYSETPANGGDPVARLVGPDVDESVEGELGAVAPNGGSAIGRDADGAFVLDAGSGDRTDVDIDTLFAVFMDR